MSRHLKVAAVVLLLAGAAGARGETTTRPAGANAPLLTTEEVHALMEAGQYGDALKAISRIVVLTGPAAAPYPRHEMLMLKAECQVEVKQYPSAVGSAEQAKKEALIAHNPNDALEAEAFAHLIQMSPGGAYSPRTAAVKTPLKLADKNQRREAFDALYADERVPFDLKAAAAQKGTSLPPYVEAMKLSPALRAAEYGSSKSTTNTDAAVKDLADGASKLVDTTLETMSTKVDKIAEEANRVITVPSNVTDRNGHSYQTEMSHKQGLSGTDPQDLREIDATCRKIPPAMLDLIRLFPEQADSFKKCASKAQDVSSKAQKTLNADYTTM